MVKKKTWILHIDILENGCFRARAKVLEPLTRETSGSPDEGGRDQLCLQELSYLGRVLKPLRKHSWGKGRFHPRVLRNLIMN